MKVHPWLPLLTCLPVLGACSEAETLDSNSSDILVGSPSSHRPSILLVASDMSVSCSGTLIAPDVVLTAAHCAGTFSDVVVDYSQVLPPGQVKVSPSQGQVFKVAETAVNPNFGGFYSIGGISSGCPTTSDLMLVRLARTVEGIEPASLGGAPVLGETCIVVGYGTHNVQGGVEVVESEVEAWRLGERRQANVRIVEIASASAFAARGIDGATSTGDSGGAVLCGSAIKGVTSCTVDRNQQVRNLQNLYARVDESRPFIDDTLRRWRVPMGSSGSAGGSSSGSSGSAGGSSSSGGIPAWPIIW